MIDAPADVGAVPPRSSPPRSRFAMSAFDRVLARARKTPRRIVLPESDDERVLRAAGDVVREGIARPLLPGDPDTVRAALDTLGVPAEGIDIVDPAALDTSGATARHVDHLVERHAARGMTTGKARAALEDRVTRACVMVATGDADGCVAGAATATADVVRGAVRQVGPATEGGLVSSCFIMLLEPRHPVDDVVVIGDCALVIEPDVEQLAGIAAATGDTARRLLDLAPEIAMLSFSTTGSARHAAVTKVARATVRARALRPDWRIVGEVQLDAAVIPAILARKDPDQATGRPCNVLVFPNLDAGNIGYKLMERFGGAQAIGPILQGLTRPVNDLSRGCSVADIVGIVAVTAAQVHD